MPDPPLGAPRGSQRFGDANVSDGSQSFQGVVHGDVHLHPDSFYAVTLITRVHLDRPETPPTPTTNIPFSRDRDFVRREALLGQVHQLCAEAASRVALIGLGGVGKSQIAIEYAYQIREQSPESWVFWLHASNAVRYEQGFRAIADLVKLPGRQDPQNNILQLVGNWLQSGKSGRWVVILDNVDNAGLLLATSDVRRDGQLSTSSHSDNLVGVSSSPTSQTPISYLPYCPHGSVLITSRSRDVALRLVEARDVVAVEPMSQVDAIALIEKKLGTLGKPIDVADTEALAKSLECMPLAIVQATSYISQRAPRCSVRQYLEKFEQSDRKRASLLDFERGQLRRDREARNSIILTWQISFNHIQKMRPSAARLLSMMCFCDRQGIPESLVRRLRDYQQNGNGQEDEEGEAGEQDKEDKEAEDKEVEEGEYGSDDGDLFAEDSASSSDSDSISSADEEFERDVSTLRDFAFVSVNEDGTTFEMHKLVQLATRKWLHGQKEEERWRGEFIRCICAELPTGKYENWGQWKVLLPQARSAAAQRPKNNQESLQDWATVLYKMAWYLKQMGRGNEGQVVAEDAMKIRMRLFGRDNKESLRAIAMVGDIYSLQGKWRDAEKLRAEVMESRKKLLGADHPFTLTSMASLALTYQDQGRWSAAEELFVEVMESRKKLLGADHPHTLGSMNNLASIYLDQGRWSAAEE
ncbi:hypothetical protein PFICI_10699 [Pestalotiopsis fici W106-1]|uniref:NB-ARC domain-containing protein n=1 Tax=Pestalotiopsis fici (strain W106-1 / CGMCC3.15140) TaxID=1229662 RepID=W3WZS4_PESFW|nr:uncharacterized protein PFICI_10699 [Pestalotiopsis fici W106-1]ETS78637.1 hypothetical protein PFICI_10699 [Pestalotiopsis fici W106-1]